MTPTSPDPLDLPAAFEDGVAGMIAAAGDRFASRTALCRYDAAIGEVVDSVTYAELYARVRSFCASLRAAGMKPGDRIVVLLDNSVDMVVTEWACLCDGFVWVALNVRSSAEEIAEILEDSRPALVVASRRYEALLPGDLPAGGLRYVEDQHVDDAGLSAGFQMTAPAATDPVRIRYTSGTSGRAKGAVLTRGGYDASVEAVSRVIAPIESGDTVIQVAPMTHASGAMLLPHVRVGARAIVVDGFDVEGFLDLAAAERATSAFLVPTMLLRVLEAPRLAERLGTMRSIVYGGASMPADRLMAGLDKAGPIFVQIYGLTESTWPVAALLRDEHQREDGESDSDWAARLASCGRPTPVGELRIVGDDGTDAPDGELGEIWVRGANTMTGYWGAGESASGGKGLDVDGWMHTGDVGRRDDAGRITIVDRLHDMIVSGGFNVYPREVEEALSTHPAVLESAVVGRPHADWGEAVHAEVVLRAGSVCDEAELIAHCGEHIAGYKKPKTVALVDALPKNASGKILRRALREQYR